LHVLQIRTQHRNMRGKFRGAVLVAACGFYKIPRKGDTYPKPAAAIVEELLAGMHQYEMARTCAM
jgi:hypothetical protein